MTSASDGVDDDDDAEVDVGLDDEVGDVVLGDDDLPELQAAALRQSRATRPPPPTLAMRAVRTGVGSERRLMGELLRLG